MIDAAAQAPTLAHVLVAVETLKAACAAIPGLVGLSIDTIAAQLHLGGAARLADAKTTASRIKETLDPISLDMLLAYYRLSSGGASLASQARIARDIGCHKSTVQIRLDDGRLDEWIFVVPRAGYRVTFETHFQPGTIEALALIAKERRNEKRREKQAAKRAEKRAAKSLNEARAPVDKPPKATPNIPVVSSFIYKTEQHTVHDAAKEKERTQERRVDERKELPKAPPTAEETTAELLVAEGVSPGAARKLVREFGVARVSRNIALGAHVDAMNPGGFLTAAIREDYAASSRSKRKSGDSPGLQSRARAFDPLAGFNDPLAPDDGESPVIARVFDPMAGFNDPFAPEDDDPAAETPPRPLVKGTSVPMFRDTWERLRAEEIAESERQIARMRRERAEMAERDRLLKLNGGATRGRLLPRTPRFAVFRGSA